MKLASLTLGSVLVVSGCTASPPPRPESGYYGTLEPFASSAVYFVLTDRFVDGDPGNNQPDQGGEEWGTFDRPLTDLEGRSGNIGYLGGDFRGILDHAATIKDLGFDAVWITPIVENPDEAFAGGDKLGEGFFADRGKTGYHGYWGINFYQVDEHLESPGLTFADFTQAMREQGLATVLDIVCNHGSPSYSMPWDQPGFGEIYDASGNLIADHQNLHPTDLDPDNPLHAFFHREPDLAQLSNIDETNPAVLEYFVGAYLKWIEQGAAAFRIDTIKHMPHAYWAAFAARIREQHPGFFMFAESFEYNAAKVAEHTWPENGGVSVLDFPLRQQLTEVFGGDGSYADLGAALYLTEQVYANPYELMTFYDNHDMPRMDADENGFIDAHNWLFTARGIPVIYYGSETHFRAGMPEHGGNRDYYGAERVAAAASHPIAKNLKSIANVRRATPALQRGLQANISLGEDQAAFLRVLETDEVTQSALVVLNKADDAAEVTIDRFLSRGEWRSVVGTGSLRVPHDGAVMSVTVPAHGVGVWVREAATTDRDLTRALNELQERARRP